MVIKCGKNGCEETRVVDAEEWAAVMRHHAKMVRQYGVQTEVNWWCPQHCENPELPGDVLSTMEFNEGEN